MKNSILAELIEEAVTNCYNYGEGRSQDEENGTGLSVTAEWTESGDKNYPSIICITIFQNGVVKLSYEDPTTKCK